MTKSSHYQIILLKPCRRGGYEVTAQKTISPTRKTKLFISHERFDNIGLIIGEFYNLTCHHNSQSNLPEIHTASLLTIHSFQLLAWIKRTKFLHNGSLIHNALVRELDRSETSIDAFFVIICSSNKLPNTLITPHSMIVQLMVAWQSRVHHVKTAFYLNSHGVTASFTQTIANLYGDESVKKLCNDPLALTPFISEASLQRLLTVQARALTKSESHSIQLIYALRHKLENGSSLVKAHELSADEKEGIPFSVKSSLVIEQNGAIQLNSTHLLERYIRQQLSALRPHSVDFFLDDEIISAANRATLFLKTKLSTAETSRITANLNLQIACLHTTRSMGELKLENVYGLTYQLLTGLEYTIVTCGQPSNELSNASPLETLHISEVLKNFGESSSTPKLYIIAESQLLDIKSLALLLKQFNPSSRLSFFGRFFDIHSSDWGSPFLRLHRDYSPLSEPAPRFLNHGATISAIVKSGKLVATTDKDMNDFADTYFSSEPVDLLTNDVRTCAFVNRKIQHAHNSSNEFSFVSSDSSFHNNDLIISNISVPQLKLWRGTFARLVSCTNTHVFINVSGQYRKLTISDFASARFSLGYCTTIEQITTPFPHYVVAYIASNTPLCLQWISSLISISENPTLLMSPQQLNVPMTWDESRATSDFK